MNIVITGAYGAIGKAIAMSMAGLPDTEIFMLGRDPGKLNHAIMEIKAIHPKASLIAHDLDLGIKGDVDEFALSLYRQVHVLINNAAAAPRVRSVTRQGLEVQWAVNVLSYYWMCSALGPAMERGSRIVNVASCYAGDADLNDPEFHTRPYDNRTAYRQSKQCNRMMTYGLATLETFIRKGISVNCCHPGGVASNVSKDLGIGADDTPERAAQGPVWLATSHDLNEVTGRYFEYKEETPCPFARDRHQIHELMKLMVRYT